MIAQAEEQELLIPQAMPTKSLEFVSQLMRSLPIDANRMLVAPISMIGNMRHAGMVVDTPGHVPIQGSCVLSLVANTGKSIIHDLPGGHKLVSKECWNVPLADGLTKQDGAPEHADQRIMGELASYCTLNNVQDYTLTARRGKEALYAVIVISSVHQVPGETPQQVYMVDKVSIINQNGDVPMIRDVLGKLACATESKEDSAGTSTLPADASPFQAKNLGACPTIQQKPEHWCFRARSSRASE